MLAVNLPGSVRWHMSISETFSMMLYSSY